MEKSYVIVYENLERLEADLNLYKIDKYIILNNQIASIYVDESFEEETLNSIKSISDWIPSVPMSSLINITDNLESGISVKIASGIDYVDKNPYIKTSGKGCIITIIDSGIDYLHPDFLNSDGTTKIVSIWDQESQVGTPPTGLKFGSEFKKDTINEYIRNNDPSLSEDTVGTGTVASGIACGRGNLNREYKGVAVDSELLVIKLRAHKDTYKEGKINYELSDFLAGIKYAIDIAQEEEKNMIINLTLGERSRSVVVTTLLDTFNYLTVSGVIVVSGAGNEGNTDIHYQGRVSSLNDIQDIPIQIGEQKNLDITLSVAGPDKIAAAIISPSGEISYRVVYAPDDYTYRGKFNIEDTFYEMRYLYPWIKSATQELIVKLNNVKPGVWTLRLFPEFVIDGLYDVYLPNKNLISNDTRFTDPNSFVTITLFGAISNAITIGAYDDKIDSVWIGSSKGPVRGRPIKPDLLAPGVDIISPYINRNYTTSTGTGVSSSMISGVVAILMEYISSQSMFSRNLLYTEVLKTYLMLGARKKDLYIYPNVTRGYGVLDLKNTFIQLAKILR